jgi:PRTRC genetic system protein C
MAKTIVSFPTQNLDSPPMGGTFSESQVRAMFAPQVPSIANMVANVTNTTDSEGQVTTYTFTPKTGNKG